MEDGGRGAFAYRLRDQVTKLKEGIHEDPIVALVDSLLYQAIAKHASDIHLEPTETEVRVRYRLDGVLHDQSPLLKEHELFVISRLKVLASLDIAQKRVPQDGKFRVNIERDVDLRVATFPCVYGEKMVIRILDRSAHYMKLESLGLSAEKLQVLTDLLKKPQGLLLVTGPTGSGKTTTLYGMLSRLNTGKLNIVTMEDPVEYHVKGVTQSQVNIPAGFTFENGLRSLLRQDPDVAMIGEIRDMPTAQIAIETALTGHLVLSTLHTNDAAGAICRLIDMGIEPFLLSASLTAVIAQRLVRVLCAHCKQPHALSPQEKQRAAAHGWNIATTWVAKGCEHCSFVGYNGRTGVFELLVMSDTLRDLIMEKTSGHTLHAAAVKEGMRPLMVDALGKVKEGVTSFEEFLRVLVG